MKQNSRLRAGALGLTVLVVMVLSVYIAFIADEGSPLTSRTEARAAFTDAGALRVGNQVRMNQRNIGRVSSIDLEDGQAVVTMELDADQPIYQDATAQILNRSGLGQVYVDVRPGSSGSGALGDTTIPIARTQSYTQVLDVVKELDAPTRKAATSALREVGGGMAGRSGDLHAFLAGGPELLTDLGTVSTALADDGGATLTSMLTSMDRLASRFQGRENEITALTDQLGATFDAIAVDAGEPLAESIAAAPETERRLREALAALDRPLADTTSAMRRLGGGSRALGNATADLRGVLRESKEPLGKVRTFADSAGPAVESLTEVVEDARPVAPQMTTAFTTAQVPLTVMAPYAPEIAKWFSWATSALGDGDQSGHWLRFTIIPATDSLSGNLPIPDPLTNSDPYPEPGEAPTQRAPEGLPGLLGGLLGGNR